MSSRTVSRLGYAAVIAILVFSSAQAYRIQGIVSEQHVEIYRLYVNQDEAISRLRRNIWLAGNYVRDFFLSSAPDRSVLLQSQIQDLEVEMHQALDQLEKLQPNAEATQLLKAGLRVLEQLGPIPASMSTVDTPAAYRFIQQKIVPRRSASTIRCSA